MSIKLGGFIRDQKGGKSFLSIIENPELSDLSKMLDNMKDKSGMVSLQISPEPEVGVYKLSLNAHDNKYLIMLSEYEQDGEHSVRTPTNLDVDNVLIDFYGEAYPARSIVSDFGLVKYIFDEFLNTGNVSKNLLS